MQRVGAWMLSIFGSIALIVSVIGLYATLALSVFLHRRELGIRLSLGATPLSVLGLVIRHGLSVAIGGAVVGVTLSMLVSHLFVARIANAGTLDAYSVFGVCSLLTVTALGASAIPALRAARIGPALVLQGDS